MTKERVRPLRLSDTSPKSNGFGGGKVGVALFIAILAVSTASIFIRFAQTDAPSLMIAALRLTFASLALAPIALTRHRAELRSLSRNELLLGLLSGLFLAIHFATWISSLEYTTVASSVVFVSTGPLMGGVAFTFFFAGAAYSSGFDRDELGPDRRNRCRVIRCLFMEQWNRLPVAESNPARTNVVRELSGADRRVDGGRLFDDRTQITREDVAHAIYLFGLWNGFGMFIDHRSGYRTRKFIRLSLADICLDFAISARAAIDRSLNL